MMTHEQIQQMFNEESDDDDFFGFESILLGSTPGWFIGPKFGAIFLFQSPKPLLQHSLLVGLITATLFFITLHLRIF